MPAHKWQVGWFVDLDESWPVFDYIYAINDQTAIANIVNVIQMLGLLGVEALLETKMCDEIASPIYELRKDRHRILFGRNGSVFVLLTAFLKRTQKTPKEEILLAEKRWRQYQQNKHIDIFRFPGQK